MALRWNESDNFMLIIQEAFQMWEIILVAMAEHQELFSFMHKFLNLCHSGFDAKLLVEAKAGHAHISLEAGLG